MIDFITLTKRETLRFFTVPNNTIIPALVSSLLYLLIFGLSLGKRIGGGSAEEYLLFLIPGLVMMNMITGSYSNPSGSIFFSRLIGFINDILLSSLSYIRIVMAYVVGGLARGVTIALGTALVGLFFAPVTIKHPATFIAYILLTGITFACLGIIIGLWADKNDQLNLLLNFVITPLIFMGGVFYSVEAIPEALRTFTKYNPIFYMVNGVRYSMTGIQEGSIALGLVILSVLAITLLAACIELFKRGWHLRT